MVVSGVTPGGGGRGRAGGDDGPAGNTFDKYHTTNPVYRRLVDHFLATVRALARRLERPAVLEVGCGEGHLARYLAEGWDAPPIVAFDVSLPVIAEARRIGGSPHFFAGSSYALPFPDASFDLVIMCEVMEHLAEPERALREIARVARRACLVSVPREPLWRVLNMARGAYLSDWGNTPGHVQWWSRRGLLRLAARHGEVLAAPAPFPWSVALFAPRR